MKRTTVTQRSAPVNLNAGTDGGFEKMGAQSRAEIMPTGTNVVANLFNFVGKNDRPTARSIIVNWWSEVAACWLIGTACGLAKFSADGTMPVIDALYVMIAYVGSYYAGTRLFSDGLVLRRHCNMLVTMLYWTVGEIGALGAFGFYGTANFAGGVLSACTIASVLNYAGVGATPNTLPVPLPLSTTSNLTTVILGELMLGAVIGCIMLCKEYLNTPINKGAEDDGGRQLMKNYKRANWTFCLWLFAVGLVFYHRGVYLISNVGYQGGMFAGWFYPDTSLLSIVRIANLDNGYPNSVWIGHGLAAMHYMLTPIAAGILGGLLFWISFFFAVNVWGDSTMDRTYRNKPAGKGYFKEFTNDKVESAAQPLLNNVGVSMRSPLVDTTGKNA